MEKSVLIKRTAYIFIFGITLFPTVVGPYFNLGQFNAGNQQLSFLIIHGIIPILIGNFFGILLFNKLLKKLKIKYIESSFKLSVEASVLTYFPLVLAWVTCQSIDFLLNQSELFSGLWPWTDVFSNVPIYAWFALFPCAIVAVVFGSILYLFLRRN